jgi:sterol desaturase/sphingolipid hydroxylase (fatty acid hydroxylase superfamily)
MLVLLIVVAIALAMLVIEQLRPARPWPRVATWWPRALAINGIQIAMVFVAGATWEKWLHGPHVLSLSVLPRGGELAIGYLAYVMWLYWAHRARHHFTPLWRWLHQLHHSPARIEILTAFYKHPLEIVLESVLGAAILYVLLGISRETAFILTNISGVLGLFYHWNIATPRWLGYIVQRPESHCVHHELGVHAFNYSELPIVDMMFGTFRNPATFTGECGLGEDRERKLAQLLVGTDLSK